MSEYVSSVSARMHIDVEFVTRKEIIKCVFLLWFINVERKARYCIIITDEAYKVKRLYVKSIVVFLLFFCPLGI